MNSFTATEFFEQLRAQLEEYLREALRDHLAAARNDTDAFLEVSRADLKRWLAELATGQIKADEFTSLVRGQAALCQLKALEQAGLAQIRLDEIRAAILELVLNAAFKCVA